ncbi:MAG: response regulator [Spirochaetaceae bacterium]|jgi:two-component system chemotaxis response regulator CheY|nr:response regulator [Spirochaetaceae bacterium]
MIDMCGMKPDGKPYRVLIVDDSVFIAKQLSQILKSEGFEVAGIAPDGRIGVQMYEEMSSNVDLVTMDITMPGMDGISALEKIRAINKNASVVMVTALGKENLVKRCMLMGAKNFIVKPIDRSALLTRVSAVLGIKPGFAK